MTRPAAIAVAPADHHCDICSLCCGCFTLLRLLCRHGHQAISPHHAIAAFTGAEGFVAGWKLLAGVMLAITGAEAMYADLGHFNARAVRVSVHWWSGITAGQVWHTLASLRSDLFVWGGGGGWWVTLWYTPCSY